MGVTNNLKGALLLTLSGLGFTLYLLINKIVSQDIHPLFLSFWRAFIGMVLAWPIIFVIGLDQLRTKRPGLLILRSLFGTAGFTLAILAVSDFYQLSLAQFNAISFSRPLFVTLLAALILRETVGWHRWSAVLIGFAGVLIMVLPVYPFLSSETTQDILTYDMGSFWALISAVSLAAAIILVKYLSAELSAMALLLYANLFSSVILLPAAIIYWMTPSWSQWGWIFLMSLTGFISQYFYISAMRIGEASSISPVDYLRLPMSSLADLAVFRLWPGLNVWFGALVIILSTLYVSWRERLSHGVEHKDK